MKKLTAPVTPMQQGPGARQFKAPGDRASALAQRRVTTKSTPDTPARVLATGMVKGFGKK